MKYRVERARELLADGSLSLTEIALACGFADQSHFTRVFTATLGTSPGSWRRINSKSAGLLQTKVDSLQRTTAGQLVEAVI